MRSRESSDVLHGNMNVNVNMNMNVNINVRHRGYSSKQSEHGETEIGFQNIYINVLKESIEEWPQELRKQFYLLGGSKEVNSENYYKVHKVLINLKENKSLNSHSHYIKYVLDLIENMKSKDGANSFHSSGTYNGALHYVTESPAVEHVPSFYLKCCGLIIVIIIISVLSSFFFYKEEGLIASESSKIEEWESNIIKLKQKFPSQNDNTWFRIRSGVKLTILEKPVQPSVFLLLHDDKKTSKCIAQTVGKEAAKLLSDSPQEPIIVRGEELKENKSLIQDYGLFTEMYKDEIEKRHVMIILDFQEIPGVLAQTFHVLCDIHNPLVHNAAFFFTMHIDEIEKPSSRANVEIKKQKPTALAEKYLKLLWKDSLSVEIMDPLITRVTDAVLILHLENNLSC